MSITTALNVEIGQRTTMLLDALQISQHKLAERAGVAQSYVSAIKAGKTLPSVVMLVGLRREFGVSLDWYLTGEGEMFAGPGKHYCDDPATADIWETLLPAVLEQGAEKQGRVRGFLQALLGDMPNQRRRAQAS